MVVTQSYSSISLLTGSYAGYQSNYGYAYPFFGGYPFYYLGRFNGYAPAYTTPPYTTTAYYGGYGKK